MLGLLLDEDMSQVVAEQVRTRRPDIAIYSVHTWEGGRLSELEDRIVLIEAARAELTLVTYDQSTIPEQLVIAFEEGRNLAGVVFIDNRTIARHDFGRLIRALEEFWDAHREEDPTNRVFFLQPAD